MRLNKFLSDAGVCSRREADRQIEAGNVSINGIVASLGTQVEANDEVLFNGKSIKNTQEKVVLAVYKPIGVECTSSTEVKNNIVNLVNYPTRVFPVGRLDKNSEGLILMTNDGELSNGILKARYYHEKEYIVIVNKPVSKAFLYNMSKGVNILDTVTRPCEVEKLDERTFKIILTQGLNRQIRRMCEALDYEVVNLKRIRVLNIMLKGLKKGEWRTLEADELLALRDIVSKNDEHAFD
ncbi:pseudouridine synthase [Fusibacter bizertensis]|uniref:Pseudouridine synthase n=1 Tax=Fusibacter bizertensis TaxID=1488331 RepID=A0ABT6NET0_9FIRM|nr:pseudouridine synthase [Fusibacter bizertensis]MDH8678934.1 pseudouridine synthase [Fusibacter bizertensis]